jgi:hypothetical protein
MRNLFETEVILLFGLAKKPSRHGHLKRMESRAVNQFIRISLQEDHWRAIEIQA